MKQSAVEEESPQVCSDLRPSAISPRGERREKNEMSQALSAHGEAAAPEDSAPEKPVKNSVELALDERLALTKFLITMSTEW